MDGRTLPGAIYTRISKDAEGRKFGVKRQERLCEARSAELGIDVAARFSDNDISASTRSKRKRPDYERMLARARNGEFAYIVAYSSSRLTRRLAEFLELIELHDKHGVQIITVNVERGQYDLSTAQGRGDAQRAASYDEQEAAITAERTKAAAEDRRQRGEFHGGPAPYGYRLVKETVLEVDPDYDPEDFEDEDPPMVERVRSVLVPEDHEVALIKEAVNRLLEKKESAYAIVKDWNARGERTRPTKKYPEGNLWRHSNFRPLLTNRTLLGENGGIDSDGNPLRPWVPVLDDETYERLDAHFRKRANGVTNPFGPPSGKYALSGGLTVCGVCGKPLSSMVRHHKGEKTPKLVCRPQAHDPEAMNAKHAEVDGKKGRVAVRYDDLEAYVFDSFVASMRESKVWERAKSETSPKVIARLNELDSERERLSERRGRIVEMREDGDITREAFKERIVPIDARLAAIRSEMDTLTGSPTGDSLPDSENDLEARLSSFPSWSARKQRDFLRLLIRRIEVSPQDDKSRVKKRATESEDEFAARRRDALMARVKIVPVWES
jgi:site-specific DNA recombinase